MFIIANSPDFNIKRFIELINESSCDFTIETFHEWKQKNIIPQGFIYIKTMPEISFKRLTQKNYILSLQEIENTFEFFNNYFITKTIMPLELHTTPMLVLNGFINFETDFSQFYNHLFYIKKFFNEIQEKHNKEKNIFIPKKHSSCKC